MNVKVEIELAQMPTAQSKQEIYNVAEQLTDNTDSISISMSRKDTPIVIAEFTIPPARQIDVVDGIGRSFWVIEHYNDSIESLQAPGILKDGNTGLLTNRFNSSGFGHGISDSRNRESSLQNIQEI